MRLFGVAYLFFRKFLLPDPLDERKNPLGNAQHGPIGLRLFERLRLDEAEISVQTFERREQHAQQKHILHDGHGDARHDIDESQTGESQQFANGAPDDSRSAQSDQQHDDEPAGCGGLPLEFQKMPDLGPEPRREPHGDDQSRKSAQLHDAPFPPTVPHGEREH